MFQDPAFRKLSSAAKALYALLVERSVLSFSNKWLDQNGRCYVIYPIAQIEEQLGCQTKKASSALTELAKIGLIRRQRSGYGSPYKITVLSYSPAASSDENTPGHSGPSLEYITPEKAKEFPYIMVPRPMLSHSAFSDLMRLIQPLLSESGLRQRGRFLYRLHGTGGRIHHGLLP